MLSTNQKGAIAETAIIAEATKLGIGVFLPIMDERYDMILDLRPRLIRVQCKWAVRQGEVVVIRCYSNRRARHGMVTRTYSANEVDAIAAHCAELNRSYLLPIELCSGRRQFHLRLSRARNNQRLGVNEARAFEFAATLGADQGAIAQLGERPDGIRKVAGSIPAGSTTNLCSRGRAATHAPRAMHVWLRASSWRARPFFKNSEVVLTHLIQSEC